MDDEKVRSPQRHPGASLAQPDLRNCGDQEPWDGSLRGTRLAQTGDAVSFLPLTAGLEKGDALKTLENIALGGGGVGGTKAAML